MGTCVVVVEQQAAGAVVWTACSPHLKDIGQANVNMPLGVDCLPLLEWNRGRMTEFGEDAIISLKVLLCFTDGLLPGKSQTQDC